MTDDTLIEGPLYEKRKKVYPQSVHGLFRRIKWGILGVTLGVYYLLPFVRWDRGPGQPSQAVLVDLPHRRFYFFFIELWPQEVYYFTGLLIIAAMTLFLMNAVAGRLWCGYMCPQSVWTDLSTPSSAGSRVTGANACWPTSMRGPSIMFEELRSSISSGS